MPELRKCFLFIDESGDPCFYGNRKKLLVGTPGFQPYLLMGLIETDNRRRIRKAVVDFMNDILNDPLYNTIPSVKEPTGWHVHARSDHPEVRAKFFEVLRKLDGFKADVVIARKNIEIFNKKHNNNPAEFYFDVLHRLLGSKFTDPVCRYHVYLSKRGNNTLHRFQEAVNKTITIDHSGKNPGITCNLQIVESREMPEFSVIDYMIWAIQRNLLQEESRYFDAVKDKYGTILQIF